MGVLLSNLLLRILPKYKEPSNPVEQKSIAISICAIHCLLPGRVMSSIGFKTSAIGGHSSMVFSPGYLDVVFASLSRS